MSAYEAQISEAVKQLEAALSGPGATNVDVDFCTTWPTAKAVLELCAKAVPAFGSVFIEAVVLVGDEYYKKKPCKK